MLCVHTHSFMNYGQLYLGFGLIKKQEPHARTDNYDCVGLYYTVYINFVYELSHV